MGVMFSTIASMPNASATERLNASVSSSESSSGINSASVRSGPNARAHRAAVTELSIPPERPTTPPRRRSTPPTIERSDSMISVATCSASIRRASGEIVLSLIRPSRLGDGALLPLDEADDVVDRVEILGHQLVVLDPDPVGLL